MSAPPSEFLIALSRGIWRVTLDGAFYGDYHAAESADTAAAALRNRGRTVTIVAPS